MEAVWKVRLKAAKEGRKENRSGSEVPRKGLGSVSGVGWTTGARGSQGGTVGILGVTGESWGPERNPGCDRGILGA